MPYSVFTSIEIAASPELVRRVFLDLTRHKEWTKRWIITTPKPATDLEAGDKIHIDLAGFKFSPVIIENSEQEFTWRGSLPLIFHGTHKFLFLPSKIETGATLLEQSEDFGGLMTYVYGAGSDYAKKAKEGFEQFNRDLKAEVERVAATENAAK